MAGFPNGAAQIEAAPMQVVGKIEVVMTEDGQILAKCQCPSRQVMLMMLETAKLDLDFKLRQGAKPAIQVAPAGMQIPKA